MTSPDLVVLGAVQETKENASTLSLTWGLRPATVSTFETASGVATVIVDADNNAINALSLIGGMSAGDRVMILTVPPSGTYVIANLMNSAGPAYQRRQTLTSSASSVTFSTIPSSLRRLEVAYTVRGDAAVQAQLINMRVNTNSSAVYNTQTIQGQAAAVAGLAAGSTTQGRIGVITGASAAAGVYGSGICTFIGWDSPHSTGLNWNFLSQALGSSTANFFNDTGGGVYLASGPYTSLTLMPASGNFISGSDFQITGWRS